MNELKPIATCLGIAWLVACPAWARAEQPQAGPSFLQVYSLVRSNLTGISDAELNRAALEGLMAQLKPLVTLVTNAPVPSSQPAQPVVRATVYDRWFGYLRPDRVEPGVADELTAQYDALWKSNRLEGLVLDLRFTGGQDYEEAARVADRFLKTEQTLLDWGAGAARSTTKANAWTVPLMVLLNAQTSGAAEALAAVLHQTKSGLLLGSRTAGAARVFREFRLDERVQLRIATGVVKLGNGDPLPPEGVQPDIPVSVAEEDERAYLADAYRLLPHSPAAQEAARVAQARGASGTLTNPPTRRVNEADLVRRHEEGLDIDQDLLGGGESRPEGRVIRDPALARALDLLKGLAVLRPSRQP